MKEITIGVHPHSEPLTLVKLLVMTEMVHSLSEAKRMIAQGAVATFVNVEDGIVDLSDRPEFVVTVGKRRAATVKISRCDFVV